MTDHVASFHTSACQAFCSGTRVLVSLGRRFKLICPHAKFPPTLVRAATTPPARLASRRTRNGRPDVICLHSLYDAYAALRHGLDHPRSKCGSFRANVPPCSQSRRPWSLNPCRCGGNAAQVRCSRYRHVQQLSCRSVPFDRPISESSFARLPSDLVGSRLPAPLPTSRRGAGATLLLPAPVPAISPRRISLL